MPPNSNSLDAIDFETRRPVSFEKPSTIYYREELLKPPRALKRKTMKMKKKKK